MDTRYCVLQQGNQIGPLKNLSINLLSGSGTDREAELTAYGKPVYNRSTI
jgi:hypothetical protein